MSFDCQFTFSRSILFEAKESMKKWKEQHLPPCQLVRLIVPPLTFLNLTKPFLIHLLGLGVPNSNDWFGKNWFPSRGGGPTAVEACRGCWDNGVVRCNGTTTTGGVGTGDERFGVEVGVDWDCCCWASKVASNPTPAKLPFKPFLQDLPGPGSPGLRFTLFFLGGFVSSVERGWGWGGSEVGWEGGAGELELEADGDKGGSADRGICCDIVRGRVVRERTDWGRRRERRRCSLCSVSSHSLRIHSQHSYRDNLIKRVTHWIDFKGKESVRLLDWGFLHLHLESATWVSTHLSGYSTTIPYDLESHTRA